MWERYTLFDIPLFTDNIRIRNSLTFEQQIVNQIFEVYTKFVRNTILKKYKIVSNFNSIYIYKIFLIFTKDRKYLNYNNPEHRNRI